MSALSMLRRFAALLVLVAGAAQAAPPAPVTTWFHNDLAGSPVAATNAAGQVIWREGYYPFGERLLAPLTENSVWFTSRRQDPETGLVYMGARYYDPVAGRFLQPDPVHFVESNVHSFNRYAYANNNPYKYLDPDGRHPFLIAIGVAVRAAAERLITFALTRGAQASVTVAEIGAGEAIGGGTIVGAGAAAKASGFIDPLTVRFTQDSVGTTFKQGGTIQDMALALKSGSLQAGDVPAIRLFDRDGTLFTLDNRRLEAFRRADVDVPYRMASPGEAAGETWKFSTKNDGTSVKVRGE